MIKNYISTFLKQKPLQLSLNLSDVNIIIVLF